SYEEIKVGGKILSPEEIANFFGKQKITEDVIIKYKFTPARYSVMFKDTYESANITSHNLLLTLNNGPPPLSLSAGSTIEGRVIPERTIQIKLGEDASPPTLQDFDGLEFDCYTYTILGTNIVDVPISFEQLKTQEGFTIPGDNVIGNVRISTKWKPKAEQGIKLQFENAEGVKINEEEVPSDVLLKNIQGESTYQLPAIFAQKEGFIYQGYEVRGKDGRLILEVSAQDAILDDSKDKRKIRKSDIAIAKEQSVKIVFKFSPLVTIDFHEVNWKEVVMYNGTSERLPMPKRSMTLEEFKNLIDSYPPGVLQRHTTKPILLSSSSSQKFEMKMPDGEWQRFDADVIRDINVGPVQIRAKYEVNENTAISPKKAGLLSIMACGLFILASILVMVVPGLNIILWAQVLIFVLASIGSVLIVLYLRYFGSSGSAFISDLITALFLIIFIPTLFSGAISAAPVMAAIFLAVVVIKVIIWLFTNKVLFDALLEKIKGEVTEKLEFEIDLYRKWQEVRRRSSEEYSIEQWRTQEEKTVAQLSLDEKKINIIALSGANVNTSSQRITTEDEGRTCTLPIINAYKEGYVYTGCKVEITDELSNGRIVVDIKAAWMAGEESIHRMVTLLENETIKSIKIEFSPRVVIDLGEANWIEDIGDGAPLAEPPTTMSATKFNEEYKAKFKDHIKVKPPFFRSKGEIKIERSDERSITEDVDSPTAIKVVYEQTKEFTTPLSVAVTVWALAICAILLFLVLPFVTVLFGQILVVAIAVIVPLLASFLLRYNDREGFKQLIQVIVPILILVALVYIFPASIISLVLAGFFVVAVFLLTFTNKGWHSSFLKEIREVIILKMQEINIDKTIDDSIESSDMLKTFINNFYSQDKAKSLLKRIFNWIFFYVLERPTLILGTILLAAFVGLLLQGSIVLLWISVLALAAIVALAFIVCVIVVLYRYYKKNPLPKYESPWQALNVPEQEQREQEQPGQEQPQHAQPQQGQQNRGEVIFKELVEATKVSTYKDNTAGKIIKRGNVPSRKTNVNGEEMDWLFDGYEISIECRDDILVSEDMVDLRGEGWRFEDGHLKRRIAVAESIEGFKINERLVVGKVEVTLVWRPQVKITPGNGTWNEPVEERKSQRSFFVEQNSNIGRELDERAAMVKAPVGHHRAGWVVKTRDNAEGVVYDDGFVPNIIECVEITPNFVADNYLVVFDAGVAGDVATDMPGDHPQASFGQNYQFGTYRPTWRNHGTFVGWSVTDKEHNPVIIKADENRIIDENLIPEGGEVRASAIWSHIVNFNLDGGNVEGAVMLDAITGITHGEKIPKDRLPRGDPTKPGHAFLGWKVIRAGVDGERIDNPTNLIINDNITLVAQWRAYNAKFDQNLQGTPGAVSQFPVGLKTANDEGKILLRDNEIPQRAGYDFDGWYQEPECRTVFDLNTVLDANKILYARWTAHKFDVVIDNSRFDDIPENKRAMVFDQATYMQAYNRLPNAGGMRLEGLEFIRWEYRVVDPDDERNVFVAGGELLPDQPIPAEFITGKILLTPI
ncbi:MAG: InlB B-repeat-containing protein, partial [Endomicrobium sp.]|nr:InlB B-repeat-containing protein [Endomicrobium sp.]